MTRRVAVFLIVLVLFLFAYVMSSYKFVIYNNSAMPIEKITVRSKWLNRDLVNIKDQQVMHFSIFAPFSKQVRISVENPNQVRSVSFEVQKPFAGEKYNQVEIGYGADIKVGELGR
jgi:hypothetical protein